jgi:phage shock protein PspC (stress-responsive transcriptional regulator)
MNAMNEKVEAATKRCPFCAEEIRAAAVKCRHCGSWLETGSRGGLQWCRCRTGKMIAGVCAGLSDYYAVPVEAVRLAAVILALIGGWGLILYAVLWILMPYRDESGPVRVNPTSAAGPAPSDRRPPPAR